MKPLGLGLLALSVFVPAVMMASLPDIRDAGALFSQYLGISALILMAWAQVMATRMPGVETVFGGLDRVYVLHKWSGVIAMAAVLVHDTIDADMRGLGRETALNDLAETLGEISLYGLLILVVLSIATFVPYHLWKWTHKAMGALFAAGVFHFVFILKPFAMTDPVGLYAGGFCLVGLLAYGWTMLPETARPSHGYTIDAVSRTGGALAVTLVPDGRGIRPVPGQFGVLRFTGAGKPEPHPFSFSRIGPDGALRVTIKPLGDFTTGLASHLAAGQAVRLQGPFGRFRQAPRGPQVWIAAGIGITPFLAWAAALSDDAPPVHLFYCYRNADEAPHLDEIAALAAQKPNLHLHAYVSADGDRLTPQAVANIVGSALGTATVAYCGPVTLRRTLEAGLKRHGVTAKRFHYEEFEFRTGVGLKRLAAWIMDRGRAAGRTGNQSAE